jgi:hypothetical protein
MQYRIFWEFLLVLVITASDVRPAEGIQTQTSRPQEHATRFTFAEGRVSFLAPPV